MKKILIILGILILMFFGIRAVIPLLNLFPKKAPAKSTIKLPEPVHKGEMSFEEAMLKRRSIRSYSNEPISLAQVSKLLFAAQGITDERGFRTAPSAGALYPLEVYALAGNVEGLKSGVYKYKPENHELVKISSGDKREELGRAALGQSAVKDAPLDIVLSAVYERTTIKYGERGRRYVHIEAGHVAQNVFLQAVSLNLGAVVIGAFSDDEVKKVIQMPEQEQPLYILPIGKK